MSLSRLAWIAAALCAVAQTPPAQPAKPPAEPEEPVIKVEVDLVNVLFSVREKKGGYISDLTKDDFTVLEDGKQQDVKFFARETNLPLTIGLLVDVSKSQEALIEDERQASHRFFSQVLRPKDMAFLISFGVDSELLQDLTNSATLLKQGLAGLRLNAGAYSPTGSPVPIAQRGTVLYEAIYLAANDRLKNEVGRKAIVVITDGNDVGSRIKIEKAIEEAQRADAIIYSVLYEDPRYTSGFYGGMSGEGPLKRMSEETGGRMFRVDRRYSLEQIYNEIQQELRSQYAIGYTPTHPSRDGGFRKVEIRAKSKDLKVQARRGYYASGS
ncbi:MAG: VWA domain-containing protein [Bryobacterales bacterium]|nr:VWA domain-containing protein [Bryobacterales bacterium]